MSNVGEIDQVRLVRDKKTNVSKRCAFVEFKTPRAFKKGLKLNNYNLLGRPLKVEFTVGGGGNSKKRREKIRMTNSSEHKEMFNTKKRLKHNEKLKKKRKSNKQKFH